MRAADCLTHFSSQVTVAFLSWGLCLCPSALGEQQAIWAGKQASFSVREHLWASINHLPWQHTSSPTHISHLARETVKANPSLLLQPSKPQPHPITCSWWALENIFMTDFFFSNSIISLSPTLLYLSQLKRGSKKKILSLISQDLMLQHQSWSQALKTWHFVPWEPIMSLGDSMSVLIGAIYHPGEITLLFWRQG